jgi:hypothetical protein
MHAAAWKTGIILVTLAVMLFPSAASATSSDPPVAAQVWASRADFSDSVTASGRLAGLMHDTNVGPGQVGLTLEATRASAKVAASRGTAVGTLVAQRQENWTEDSDLAGSVIHSAGSRDFYFLAVIPMGDGATMELASSEGTIKPSRQATVEARHFVVSDVESPTSSALDAVAWESGAHAVTAIVRGSFVVVAWEYDFTVDGTGAVLRSGTESEPVADPAPSASSGFAAKETKRQTYIFVEEGTLTVMAADPDALAVFIDDATVDVSGSATFVAAKAEVADGSEFRSTPGELLTIDGSFSVDVLDVETEIIPMKIRGTPNAITIDGKVVPWAASVYTENHPGFNWWPIAIIGFVATPGLIAGSAYSRRWLETSRMSRLEDMVEMGQWKQVAAAAPRLQRSTHFGFDASVIRVDALIRLGRLDEALSVASRMRAPNEMSGPVVEFTLAYLHAARGDRKAAIHHALECLKGGPEYREHIRTFPEFASIRNDPRFKGQIPPEPTAASPPGYA